ncbi:MAG: class I SAM-dependent methyltransferase [Dehalococcoidia bacterium]
MAASSAGSLAMKVREYFDQLAPTWDEELTPEKLKCLGNIVQELSIKPGCCVLDAGSGTGVLLPFVIAQLGGEGKIVALDFSAEMLGRAKAKNFPPIVSFAQANIVAIPLADNCVDLAICNSAFPHFDDKAKALKEIARVLKYYGRLVICHTMGRKMVNQLHQSIGGVIANDLLPDESELKELINSVGLKTTHFEDNPGRYLVIAKKSTH